MVLLRNLRPTPSSKHDSNLDRSSSGIAVNSEESTGLFNVFRTLSCGYFSVSIPLRIAFLPDFEVDMKQYPVFVVLDLISTILFMIDAIQSYRRDCLEVKNMAKISPDMIGYEYRDRGISRSSGIKTRSLERIPVRSLCCRIMASLPLEYISLWNNHIDDWVNYYMLNRILIILRLPAYIEDLVNFFEAHGLKNVGIQRAWKLFFAMALAGHWCCCGFFLVGKMEAMSDGDLTWTEDLGLVHVGIIDDDGGQGSGTTSITSIENVLNAYIQGLYWAYITMITTGFGDIVPLALPETVWCIFSMCLGVIITSCAIANLQLLVTNADAAFAEYQRKTENVAKYMKYRRLPNDLQDRIMAFYRYQWDLLKGANEVKFLNELPSSIQQQVSNFMCRDLIASLPLLRNANLSLLNALADSVEINIYSPNDEILKKGDLFKGAILVSRGEVEVLSGMTIERKMRRLDHYAAESLFTAKKKSDKTIRGRTFCEIFLLPTDDFQQIIHAQCDGNVIMKMKEKAMLMAKSASKVNKLFGLAEDHLPTSRFQRIFYPDSAFRYTWDFITILGCLYYCFSIPLMIMRYLDEAEFSDHLTSFILSYSWDLYFLFDQYLSFTHFMHYKEGLIVFDRHRIRQEFLRQRNFFNELVGSLPIDVFGVMNVRWCFILRLSKLVRLPTLVRSIWKFERILADFKLEKGLAVLKILWLNLALIITCHWIGCLWHSCANLSIKIGYENTWLQQDEADVTLSINHSDLKGTGAYVRSVYWALVGTSTVGYGDIVPQNILETTFATVVILFGGLILPAIVGGLAAFLGNIDLAERKYRRKLYRIKQYLRQQSMSKELIERVLSYYDYLWSRQGDMDEESVLDELPLTLRKEVSSHVNRSHIDSVPFFLKQSDSFKDLLGLSLKVRIFVPFANIINHGEVGSSLYFLEKGEAAVISGDGFVNCILRKGNYFGEGALLSARISSSTVKALSYCDVFELTREDFQEIVTVTIATPSLQDALVAAIKDSLYQNQIINENVKLNFKNRPKCVSLVSRELLPDEANLVGNHGELISLNKTSTLWAPESAVCFAWGFTLVFVILYNLWMIPFRVSSPETGLRSHWVDWTFDCILGLDMYLSYCRFSFHRNGELVFDPNDVRSNYKKSRLKSDILSTLPYDLIYILAVHPYQKVNISTYLRLPRLFWVSRLPTILNTIFRYLEDANFNVAPLKLVEFLFGVVLIAHWAGCGFILLAMSNAGTEHCDYLTNEAINLAGGLQECSKWKGTWIHRQMKNMKLPRSGGTSLQRYLRAINWALPTLVVVVIGDVVPVNMHETLYALLWMVVGVSVNAAIIGNVANIVANIDADSLCFKKKSDDIKRYMKIRNVSPALLSRVDLFMTEFWAHSVDVNGDSFLAELPKTLQIQVTERTRYWHISHCPFFDFCSVEIVKALSLRLKLALFSSHDNIISYGDNGVEMFFLERGTVDVMSADNKTVFATLSADTKSRHSTRPSVFFGETSLFFKKCRTGTVRAVTFCEVYRLHKKDLDAELGIGGRDFDLSRMLEIFVSIAESNEKRNKAVTSNLQICRSPNTKLSKLINPDENFRVAKPIPAIFKPGSSFRICFDALGVFFTIYYVAEIPFRSVFLYQDDAEELQIWMLLDFSLEIFFVIEVYLRLYHFPIIENGMIIADSSQFQSKYAKNGLFTDAIVSIPVVLLSYMSQFKRQTILFARILHLLRIVRLPSYMGRMEVYLNMVNIRISAAARLLARVWAYYFLVIHFYACVWFGIHRFLEAKVQFTWATTDCPLITNELASKGCLSSWLEVENRHDICNGDMIGRCYLRSIYFVLTTMSTVGYGDISPVTELETIFQNIVVLTGACFFAGMIGSFCEFLSHNDESGTSAFKTKLKRLQEYMNYRKLPSTLQQEILFYHRARWNRSHVLEEKEVTRMLSKPLQIELSYEMLSHVVQKFPVLQECSTVFQKRICHALTLQMCPKNTSIYHAGDIGWDIYFIEAGLVKMMLPTDLSILDEEGKRNFKKTKEKAAAVGLIYRPGNHFGESCLDSKSGVRRESTIATTIVELYLLSTEKFEEVLSYTPIKERNKIKQNLLRRNGNVWHSFDEDEDKQDLKVTPKRTTLVRQHSRLTKSPVSFLSWTRPQRYTLMRSSSGLQQLTTRNKPRLRSFSAEASNQVLSITGSRELDSDGLRVLNENVSDTTIEDTSNPLIAARLCQRFDVSSDNYGGESDSVHSSRQNSNTDGG